MYVFTCFIHFFFVFSFYHLEEYVIVKVHNLYSTAAKAQNRVDIISDRQDV